MPKSEHIPDVALIECHGNQGITLKNIERCFTHLRQTPNGAFPIEISSDVIESTACGFITSEMYEKLDWNLEETALYAQVKAIMGDMSLEKPDGVYILPINDLECAIWIGR